MRQLVNSLNRIPTPSGANSACAFLALSKNEYVLALMNSGLISLAISETVRRGMPFTL